MNGTVHVQWMSRAAFACFEILIRLNVCVPHTQVKIKLFRAFFVVRLENLILMFFCTEIDNKIAKAQTQKSEKKMT